MDNTLLLNFSYTNSQDYNVSFIFMFNDLTKKHETIEISYKDVQCELNEECINENIIEISDTFINSINDLYNSKINLDQYIKSIKIICNTAITNLDNIIENNLEQKAGEVQNAISLPKNNFLAENLLNKLKKIDNYIPDTKKIIFNIIVIVYENNEDMKYKAGSSLTYKRKEHRSVSKSKTVRYHRKRQHRNKSKKKHNKTN